MVDPDWGGRSCSGGGAMGGGLVTSGSERREGLSPSQELILEAVLVREEARHRREQAAAVRTRSKATVVRSGSGREAAGGDSLEALIHEVEGLNEALATRMVISNAVGLLMAWGAVDRDEAFDHLRRASQRSRRRLRDIANEIVEEHERRVRASGASATRPPARGSDPMPVPAPNPRRKAFAAGSSDALDAAARKEEGIHGRVADPGVHLV